jgi:hypothetical protein
MKYWRVNTDKLDEEKIRTCDVWYQYGMVFTGDSPNNKLKHVNLLKKLQIGDGIFMHYTGLGIVGYGIVQEPWNEIVYQGINKLLYRAGVSPK